MLVCPRDAAGPPRAALLVPVSLTLLSMVLLSMVLFSTATSARAGVPGTGAQVAADGDDVGQRSDATPLATSYQRLLAAAEPASTEPLILPVARAVARTARAFQLPGLVIIALMIGFGLAGRVTRSEPTAQPKLDDDLRSFS